MDCDSIVNPIHRSQFLPKTITANPPFLTHQLQLSRFTLIANAYNAEDETRTANPSVEIIGRRDERDLHMTIKRFLIVLSTLALASIGGGCDIGGSGGSSGAGYFADAYSGPGSVWTVYLVSDGTFDIDRSDMEGVSTLNVYGTYERFGNGFIELTVSGATGADAPSPGDMAMAVEVPGFAFMLRPLDENGEIIPMVLSGSCPSENVTANWIMTTCNSDGDSCDASDNSRDLFGTFAFDFADGTASLPSRYALADGSSLGSNDIGTATCTDGIMFVDDVLMYLTENQGAIVQISPTDHDQAQHVLALPQETLTLTELAGDYVGLGFDKADETSFAVSMTIDDAGTSASIFQVSDEDLEAGTPGSSVATIAFTAANSISGNAEDGWVTGTFSVTGEPDRPIYCMAASDVAGSGKNMLLCIGQSPGDATQFYNLIMVSAD
jgi:hypothetical protein